MFSVNFIKKSITDIFWTQTCEFSEDKEVVWAVIEKQEIPKTHRLRLRRLIEYGFILEDEAENSLLCVFLFLNSGLRSLVSKFFIISFKIY